MSKFFQPRRLVDSHLTWGPEKQNKYTKNQFIHLHFVRREDKEHKIIFFYQTDKFSDQKQWIEQFSAEIAKFFIPRIFADKFSDKTAADEF